MLEVLNKINEYLTRLQTAKSNVSAVKETYEIDQPVSIAAK
jgi:hypothetical protein